MCVGTHREATNCFPGFFVITISMDGENPEGLVFIASTSDDGEQRGVGVFCVCDSMHMAGIKEW